MLFSLPTMGIGMLLPGHWLQISSGSWFPIFWWGVVSAALAFPLVRIFDVDLAERSWVIVQVALACLACLGWLLTVGVFVLGRAFGEFGPA